MKVLKPQRLSLIQRVIEHRRERSLVVSVIVWVPLDAPRSLLTEQSLWKAVGEELPSGIIDEGLPKPNAEVLITGSAFAPDATTSMAVRLQLGSSIDKQLAVFGDRYWKNDTFTEAVPFRQMPIEYNRAFGGEGFANNPLGKGVVDIEAYGEQVRPLPNIELSDALVRNRKDRPEPAGFGGYDLMWPQRFDKVGTYDTRWLKTLFPGMAEDFDAHMYNTAPHDQQLSAGFVGDETYSLQGMHPSKPTVDGRLEPLVVRAFVTQRQGDDETFIAISTRLDTVHFFPHLERAAMVYRGTLPVAEDDAEDIVHLMVAAESPRYPKPLEHYQRVLAQRLDKDVAALASLKDEDLMPPESEGWAARIDVGDLGDMMRLELAGADAMERGRKKKLAEAREGLERAGIDPDAYGFDDGPEMAPLPDPYDFDAIIEYTANMEIEAAKQQKELESRGEVYEENLRKALTEAGIDYDSAMLESNNRAARPPDFSAEAHLGMLHDLSRIAHEGGVPLEDVDQDLLDPRYLESLQELEELVQQGYRMSAHMLPAASPLGTGANDVARARLTAARDSDEPLHHLDLAGADLSDMDLSGIDLGSAVLIDANLRNTVLCGAKLSRAVFARSDMRGADLSEADLTHCNLGRCNLTGANLAGSDLSDAVLHLANLDRAVFAGAKLHNVNFLETTIKGIDLSHVDAEKLFLIRVTFDDASFIGARFESCFFIETNIENADFTGAVLNTSHFLQTRGDGACFAGAQLDNSVFVHGSSFNDCSFAGARLRSANFRKTPLVGADFEAAQMDGADLSGADLTNANLHRIVATQSNWTRAVLNNANLRGANLMEALMSKAHLYGTDLSGCNLSRGDVSLVRGDTATKIDNALMLDTRVDPKYQAQPQ